MRGRDKFIKLKPIISILIFFYKLFPKKVRVKIFYKKRYVKGNRGILIRYSLLKTISFKIGENVSIFESCFILNPENLTIGNNVSIHPMCYLECLGGLYIGNDVSIAHGASILTTSHNYFDLNLPIKEQGISKKNVVIEDNVWIGAKATILYGKTINNGSIIGAGAVVTKDVEFNSIVAGIPAKVIKVRTQ